MWISLIPTERVPYPGQTRFTGTDGRRGSEGRAGVVERYVGVDGVTLRTDIDGDIEKVIVGGIRVIL